MGWIWSNNDHEDSRSTDYSQFDSSSSRDIASGSVSTKKVVRSHCRTEEVEPGKFIRKCEKTEELLRNCAGKPVEVLQSNNEYTEEDITDEVLKGRSGSSNSSSDNGVLRYPDLRRELEIFEHGIFGDLSRLFDMAAEEMRSGLYGVFGKSRPEIDADSSPSSSFRRRGIPVEEYGQQEAYPKSKDKESGDTDFSALAKDV